MKAHGAIPEEEVGNCGSVGVSHAIAVKVLHQILARHCP